MSEASFREIPEEWKPRLRAWQERNRGERRDRLSAGDFPGDTAVRLTFEDGSFALFRHAFAVPDEAGRRFMVFTEHGGYHIFPVGADGVEVVSLATGGAIPVARSDREASGSSSESEGIA
jgi:hypothetical protein